MTIANTAQFESWNGDSGTRWVARADERDLVLAPVAEALLSAARLAPGEQVLDIGCGCGATTLAAARVGHAGAVTGLDLSAPMLELARRRAADEGIANVAFIQGDAQTHALPASGFDLVISRFGTMFFADPVTAFTNLRSALQPGGRLAIATWQPLTANEWLLVPAAALLEHVAVPEADAGRPGMFSQAEPAVVRETLDAAGLVDVAFEAVEVTLTVGATLDAAVDHLADTGPGRLLLDAIPEGEARGVALADVRATLSDHARDGAVRLGAAIWIVTARRPEDPPLASRGS